MDDEIIIIISRPPDFAEANSQSADAIRFNASTRRGLRAAREYIDGMLSRMADKSDEE